MIGLLACFARLAAAGTMVVALAACGGVPDAGESGSDSPTASAGESSTPMLTGDLVVFQAPGVVVTDLAGSVEVVAGAQLPSNQQTNPDWSPDGSALVVAVSDGERDDLWTVRPDGSDPQLLLDCRGDCLYLDDPAWSPDGQQVLFNRVPYDESPPTLETVDVSDGSTRVLLTADPGTSFSGARWSPDGARIVFERLELDPAGSGEVVGVVLMLTSVAEPVQDMSQLTDPEIFAVTPDWGPNGQRIVFSGLPEEGSERTELFTIEPSGEGLVRVTRLAEAGGSAAEPAWAPDGRIWFVAAGAPGGGDGLAVVDAAGGEVGPAIGDTYVPAAHPRLHAAGA